MPGTIMRIKDDNIHNLEIHYDSLSFSINSTVSYIFTMKFNYFSIYTHLYNEIQLFWEEDEEEDDAEF